MSQLGLLQSCVYWDNTNIGLWEKMQRSPEADLIRMQARLSLKELAEKSDPMARNIIASPKLLSEVNVHIQKLPSGTVEERESLGAEIASRHPEAIPSTMEDRRAQAALVLRVAELIDEKRRSVR